MKINIGDNNKIEKTNIGEKNIFDDKGEKDKKNNLIIEIVVGIIISVISGYVIFLFGWN